MGVPKFYRWLSERYPKIVQRHGCAPSDALVEQHFGKPAPRHLPPPDPLSECGLPPEMDRLYIDMNGILHGCSHNNNSDESDGGTTEIEREEIYRNVAYYLDRIVADVARPRELLYLAIDGVAPRAKLNQQRARRYRAGKEGEIERTVYDAHLERLQQSELNKDDDDASHVKEVSEGRFAGKFETKDDEEQQDFEQVFHSNGITPGTLFFQECTTAIEALLKDRLANDPAWKHLTIIFSGPNCPGEGEHKIMQFIREQQQRPDYDPNLRHCIMGQDGDLIMLGLATHEPNLMLLREQVVFDKKLRAREKLACAYGLDVYLHNPNFEFLHMNVLRDYLAYEFETSNVVDGSPFDLERTIDDFVFMTFFVGNDFLPHMPALDIADEAFDLLFYSYREKRREWLKQGKKNPYLTHAGEIVSGARLESFLSVIGSHENPFFDYKKSTEDIEQTRKFEARYGQSTTPSDAVIESKEAADRQRYREMLRSAVQNSEIPNDFAPVVSQRKIPARKKGGKKRSDSDDNDDDDEEEDGLFARMGSLLQYSVSSSQSSEDPHSLIDDQDVKGRYYYDKFGFSPFDAEAHVRLRKSYMEGLVWNLKYYYEGCVSWDWMYPYYYGPMISDLVGLDAILAEISFEGRMGAPLKPFEQLMACLPPSHSGLLPEPYRPLMTEPTSPIVDFYPRSFTIDMNGKRLPWEAVVLLPFVDTNRLIEAANTVDESALTEEERSRNVRADTLVMASTKAAKGVESNPESIEIVPFQQSHYQVAEPVQKPLFRPALAGKVDVPLPGYPTLRDGSIVSIWRKRIRVNVHGVKSRYKTACLEMENSVPEIIPIEGLAKELIGTAIFINYPYLIEGFVTAVSDATTVIRGSEQPRPWTARESSDRKAHVATVISEYVFGEKLVGTGGLTLAQGSSAMEGLSVLINVRPLKGLKTTSDGTIGKTYAKFEVEVPLFVTSWAPFRPDPRLVNVPALLERNPYKAARFVVTDPRATNETDAKQSNKRIKSSRPSLSAESLTDSSIQARGFHSCASIAVQHPWPPSHIGHGFVPTTALSRQTVVAQPTTFQHRLVPYEKRSIASIGRVHGKSKGRFASFGVLAVVAFFSAALGEAATAGWGANPLMQRDSIVSIAAREGTMAALEGYSDHPYSQRRATPPLDFAHGTTTLSFTFKDGIVVAVDSRASLGSFVGSKTTKKVLPIDSHMIGTMAGGAADCSIWIRKLKAEAAYHRLTEGSRMSVARASRLLSNALYENRGLGLSIGTMIAGFDDEEGSPPKIFYVDNSGLRIEGDLFAVGSGSTFALGILDNERRHDMTADEAVALGIKAIRHATFRDAYSGGFINVYLVTREGGWKHVFAEDLALLTPGTDGP